MRHILTKLAFLSITAAASADDSVFFVRGDYLLFKPELDGLILSSKATFDAEDPDARLLAGQATLKPFHTDWQSAFRVGLGCHLPSNCWEIEADWTHLNSTNTGFDKAAGISHTTGSATGFNGSLILLPVTLIDTSDGDVLANISTIKGRWNLQLDDVVLKFSREITCGPSFFFTPFVGIRGVSIQQKLHYEYDLEVTGQIDLATMPGGNSRFYALGATGGLEARLMVCPSFGFYGFTEVSGVYGQCRTSSVVNLFASDPSSDRTASVFNTLKENYNALRTILDSGIGIEWRGEVGPLCFILLRLGWEGHNYLNQNCFLKFRALLSVDSDPNPPKGLSNKGNLTLTGGVFSAKIYF